MLRLLMVRSSVLTGGEIFPTDTACRFNGRLKLHNRQSLLFEQTISFFATVRAYRLTDFM